MQIEMSIKGLMVDPITNMPIVILRDKDGQQVLPIWVGIFEANAIALQIENIATPRPMTTTCCATSSRTSRRRCRRVVVCDCRKHVLRAHLPGAAGDTWRSTRARATRSRWRCGRGRRFSSRTRSSTTPRRSTSPPRSRADRCTSGSRASTGRPRQVQDVPGRVIGATRDFGRLTEGIPKTRLSPALQSARRFPA
jgi:hypothetical protein